MFEGLDQIDWENIGRHFGKTSVIDRNYLEEIPERIRALNSLDEDAQSEAMLYLFGEKGEFGAVRYYTSYVIPFVIELVGLPETPEREFMLDYLLRVADNILNSNHLSVGQMRLHVNAYDSIVKKIDILMTLLDDETKGMRIGTIDLLGKLSDHAEILLPELFRRFDVEKDEDIKIALLNSVKALLNSLDWHQDKLKGNYGPLLRDIVESNSSEKIQLVAARASVEIVNKFGRYKDILSDKVPELLSKEFLRRTFYPADYKFIHWKRTLEYSTSLLRDLAQLGHEPLLVMLQNSKIDSIQAHLIVRGLFASILARDENLLYWDSNLGHTNVGIYYLLKYGTGDYRALVRNKDQATFFKQILQTVVENEKAWELPTNMFSFFFGLPNSREELQEVLSSIS